MKKLLLLLISLLCYTAYIYAVPLAAADSIVKILAIGNSFSEDAIENHLHELAAASDKKTVIGNLYIGGAPLSLHVENVRNNNAHYSYRKIAVDGTKTTTSNVSIAQALADEDWDYISFQQASPLSGKYETIVASLPELITYVRTQVGSSPRFVYHQTWAYQQNSQHEGFKNYSRDQIAMYKAIAETSKKVSKLGFFELLVPAGTAIQNARTSSMGDTYTRDGYHLQLDYGRFTAACTWFEKIFGEDVRKNSYKPNNVTDVQAIIAKEAAHKAVRKPYRISAVRH